MHHQGSHDSRGQDEQDDKDAEELEEVPRASTVPVDQAAHYGKENARKSQGQGGPTPFHVSHEAEGRNAPANKF